MTRGTGLLSYSVGGTEPKHGRLSTTDEFFAPSSSHEHFLWKEQNCLIYT